MALALGGILSLSKTPESLSGLENVTGASAGIVLSRKLVKILAEMFL